MNVVRLVLEVTKPIGSIDIVNLAKYITELKNVKSVTIKLSDSVQIAQILILTIEGSNLDYEYIAKALEKMNITISRVIEIYVLRD